MRRQHRTLPRILTRFKLAHTDTSENDAESTVLVKPTVLLPDEIVDTIIGWVEEFARAELKCYYYNRFMKKYRVSLVKSSSRLKLYTRELKAMAMKHRTLNEPPTFCRFVRDSNRCKRQYNYEQLVGIFF